MGSTIEFKRPDGATCKAYLSTAGQDRPGVVVIQEWWGLNAQICGIADRLAEIGYNALAPDLYNGKLAKNADEASHMMNHLDFPDATHQDIRGAVEYLHTLSQKVGVMGYCMGGALAIAAAVHVPDTAAVVCYYGVPPKPFADPALIKIPFQGHFATRDDWITPAVVADLERSMLAVGNPPEIYSYEADHAFCNQTRPEVYNATSAKLAWDRTIKFWGTHLT